MARISTIKLLTWICMDGCLVFRNNNIHHIQFKLSKERKIKELEKLLSISNIKYTKQIATKSGMNKLQPYLIRIYGDFARELYSLLGDNKTFPEFFKELNQKETTSVLDTLEITDGTRQNKRIIWISKELINYNILKQSLDKYNIPSYSKVYKNTSGFLKRNLYYRITITYTGE